MAGEVLIGGVDVSGLVMSDAFPLGIESEIETANDGTLIIYEKKIQYVEIDLLGGPDWGWLSLSVLKSLQDLAKVVGATYELSYEGDISLVRFRTEDKPVIYGERLINRSNQEPSDYYKNILIKLMEI